LFIVMFVILVVAAATARAAIERVDLRVEGMT